MFVFELCYRLTNRIFNYSEYLCCLNDSLDVVQSFDDGQLFEVVVVPTSETFVNEIKEGHLFTEHAHLLHSPKVIIQFQLHALGQG